MNKKEQKRDSKIQNDRNFFVPQMINFVYWYVYQKYKL